VSRQEHVRNERRRRIHDDRHELANVRDDRLCYFGCLRRLADKYECARACVYDDFLLGWPVPASRIASATLFMPIDSSRQ
jgi:hypothetical protein